MRRISIGAQGFEQLRQNNYFYVDKTPFIKEWWENGDVVTLITRPRRFGKTLGLDMLNCFFSNQYAGRSDLFEGLDIMKEKGYQDLQGTMPVLFLSFAQIKETRADDAIARICLLLKYCCTDRSFLLDSERLNIFEKEQLRRYCENVSRQDASDVLNFLSRMLYKHFRKRVLIFLDEYDTPLQEAYTDGYWPEMSAFIRELFNSAFKTNPSLERAVMTGITRVSKESIFSDLNNPEVVSTTSLKYQTSFGFTQEEVDDALREFRLENQEEASLIQAGIDPSRIYHYGLGFRGKEACVASQ